MFQKKHSVVNNGTFVLDVMKNKTPILSHSAIYLAVKISLLMNFIRYRRTFINDKRVLKLFCLLLFFLITFLVSKSVSC